MFSVHQVTREASGTLRKRTRVVGVYLLLSGFCHPRTKYDVRLYFQFYLSVQGGQEAPQPLVSGPFPASGPRPFPWVLQPGQDRGYP